MFTSVTPHPVAPAASEERSGLARLWHQLGWGSGRRYAQQRDEAQRLVDLRFRWQQACEHVGLGLTMYTPSGITVSVPRIAHAHFGSPVSFTVRLRPGQKAADIAAAAPRLARALRVAGLRVALLEPHEGFRYGDDGGGDFWDGEGPGRPRVPVLRVA